MIPHVANIRDLVPKGNLKHPAREVLNALQEKIDEEMDVCRDELDLCQVHDTKIKHEGEIDGLRRTWYMIEKMKESLT